jgi:hypothetical protein
MAAAGVTVGTYKPDKSEPGPPMTLANMRDNRVRRLIIYCLSPYCHHSAEMDGDANEGAVPVKSFQRAWFARAAEPDVRPNWTEAPLKPPLR